MSWMDGVLWWVIGWILYEVLAVLLMAEWHIGDWVRFLWLRFLVWPFCLVLLAIDLIKSWREYGTIDLWWWRR